MEDQEKIYTHMIECQRCFVNWPMISCHKEAPIITRCHHCRHHPDMTSKELLIRRIEVLNHAKASRFPEVINHLVKHIDLKEWP